MSSGALDYAAGTTQLSTPTSGPSAIACSTNPAPPASPHAIVRVRRRGTLGIEAYMLREGLKVEEAGETFGLAVGKPEAMAMLAALTGGEARSGKA